MTTLASDAIWAEFLAELNVLVVLNVLAPSSIRSTVEVVNAQPDVPENPDPEFIVGHGAPNQPDAVVLGRLRRSELNRLVAKPNSRVEQLMVHQLIVFSYALWNDRYRPRIAKALGVDLDRVVSDQWGDIRRLRHDIVHQSGVASAQWSGKCILPKVLSEVTVGQPLALTALWFGSLLQSVQVQVAPAPAQL